MNLAVVLAVLRGAADSVVAIDEIWSMATSEPSDVDRLAAAFAPVRFLLDFLRVTDVSGADARNFDFTPAQYGCILREVQVDRHH